MTNIIQWDRQNLLKASKRVDVINAALGKYVSIFFSLITNTMHLWL